MKLIDLMVLCDAAYPDGVLLELVDESGQPHLRDKAPQVGDTLAVFIVHELAETFVEDATDAVQLAVAKRVLANASDQLQALFTALDRKHNDVLRI